MPSAFAWRGVSARLTRCVVPACCLLIAACAGAPAPRPAAPPAATAPDAAHAVIVVSIDALPASIPGTGTMPTLDAIAAQGVRAEWLTPSVPTLTFPNHYTLVTGLYPDHHGIVHNNMIDPELGTFVSKNAASADDGRWWGGEPIWATLQKQGGIAATMFWPGSNAEIAGQRPRYRRAFDKTVTPAARIDQVLAWLDLPPGQRPQLLTVYFDQYDIAAHDAGAASPPAMASLQALDAALARLRDGLRARGVDAATDVIVVSDHGMADVPQANVRYLDDMLPTSAYRLLSWGAWVGIAPAPGHEADVAQAFVGRHDHYACWRKAELPAVWHIGTHRRIAPIVCQADVGWRLQARSEPLQSQPVKGEHGFAPETPGMHATFVATGPSFRPGTTLPAFDNVDIYPLLAHLLRVRPAPNDGTLAPLLPALRDAVTSRGSDAGTPR